MKQRLEIATGFTNGKTRLSVGIEHIDDIIADFDQALKAGDSAASRAQGAGVAARFMKIQKPLRSCA